MWGTNIARAASPAGPWQKFAGGPVVRNPEQGFGMDGPELLVKGGRTYLYYRRAGADTERVEIRGIPSPIMMSEVR